MKYLTLTILTVHFTVLASAQVGIGVSGTVNSSAKLQVDASSQGFLPPRIALQGTDDATKSTPRIANPATGLLVYNTASAGSGTTAVTPGIYYYDGSKWQRVINQQPDATVTFDGTNPNPGNGASNFSGTQNSTDFIYVSNTNASQWTWNGSAYVSYTPPASTAWMLSGNTTDAGSNKSDAVFRTGSVAIGGSTSAPITSVNASAQLEVISTAKGFLPPRMTTTQRDAITSPAAGLIIYNTTNNSLEIRSASAWLTLTTLTGTETLTSKTLTTPVLSASSDATVPAAGTVRYNSASGGILQYSNASAWNTLTSTVQKSVVTGYFTDNITYPVGSNILTCTETQDRNNDFSSSIFTAPRAGLYLVTVNLLTTNRSWAVGDELNIGAYRVGSSVFFLAEYFAQAAISTWAGTSASCVISLTQGQQVNFQTYCSKSFSLYGQNYNQFSITEL